MEDVYWSTTQEWFTYWSNVTKLFSSKTLNLGFWMACIPLTRTVYRICRGLCSIGHLKNINQSQNINHKGPGIAQELDKIPNYIVPWSRLYFFMGNETNIWLALEYWGRATQSISSLTFYLVVRFLLYLTQLLIVFKIAMVSLKLKFYKFWVLFFVCFMH